jgi:hypothetical protein
MVGCDLTDFEWGVIVLPFGVTEILRQAREREAVGGGR